MILGIKEKLIESGLFLDTFTTALRNLILVRVEGGEESSGLLLTNDLVAIPNFLERQKQAENVIYSCFLYDDLTKPVEATPVYHVPLSTSKIAGISLFRLKTPLEKGHRMVLEMEDNTVGDPVFIVQYNGTKKGSFFSFGEIKEVQAQWICYDADTSFGSSGSPVFNARNGKLIAIHLTRSTSPPLFNKGLKLTEILEQLRNSDCWQEITKFYNITDIRKIETEIFKPEPQPQWKGIHMEAALSWNMDKSSLSEEEQKVLKPHVIDSTSPHWVLKPSDRTAILQSTAKTELTKIQVRQTGNTFGQKVIDRILKGGPYNMDEMDEKELPFWLQAVRWFASLDDKLPSSAEVNRALERKRIRSRLATLSGFDFKGRKKELKELRDWYLSNDNVPLMINGIGGIGKSTLISHFALSLPNNTPILWLDFDRADIAPDDAKSVLNALSEQVSIQTEGFTPPDSSVKWEEMAANLGDVFAKVLDGFPPALLVLDGFEVAQHIKQYTEIWRTLELIMDKYHHLKIIVSGRALVPSLSINNKAAESIKLKGMEPADAKGLLAEHKIVKKRVVDEVVRISRGIPLVLKLAIHYVDSGNKLEDLPTSLPEILIEGYLYQRILDRVVDVKLKPVCRKALVLRKISVEIIQEILMEGISTEMTAEEIFEGLSREMGLIGENETLLSSNMIISSQPDSLQLRPELRMATIKLLEAEDVNLVKEIDRKAVDYYIKKNLDNFECRAELIYHLLRSGRLEEAKKYWMTECAPLLKYADKDLPDVAHAERSWLQGQIGHVIGEQQDDIKIWEIQSVKQIKDLLGRGHFKGVSEILKQRSERSDNSPLLLYDAWWMYWIEDDINQAIEMLSNSQPTIASVARNQNIFRAFLEVQTGNIFLADQILSSIDLIDWKDKQVVDIETLALHAARIRFTVNIDSEIDLVHMFKNIDPNNSLVKSIIGSKDVISPFLTETLSEGSVLESTVSSSLRLPINKEDRAVLESYVNASSKNRSDSLPQFDLKARDLKTLLEDNKLLFEAQGSEASPEENLGKAPDYKQTAYLLAIQSWLRWRYATTSFVLSDFANLAVHKKEEIDPLVTSILASLAAFRGVELGVFVDGYEEDSIDCFLKKVLRNNPESKTPPLNEKRKIRLFRFLNEGIEDGRMTPDTASIRMDVELELKKQNNFFTFSNTLKFLANSNEKDELVSIILYLFGPDPLEMLCRRMMGFPDNYKL